MIGRSLTMATAAGVGPHPPSAFKCRKCRRFLFSGDSVLPSPSPGRVDDATSGSAALWYISDCSQPPWIQRAIEKAQWTRGKLACPRCGARLGSFDYLSPSIRHCQERRGPWSCVQVIGSRVDRETSLPALASCGRPGQPDVRSLPAEGSAQEPPRGSTSRTDRAADGGDATAEGCGPLYKDDWQQDLGNCSSDAAQVEPDHSHAEHCGEKSIEELLPEAATSSHSVTGPNLKACCGEDSVLPTPICKSISTLSSNVQSNGRQNKCKQGHADSTGQPLPSQACAEHERIMFGFFEHERGRHARVHPGTRIEQDVAPCRSPGAVPSSDSSVGSKLTMGLSEADETYSNLSAPGPVAPEVRHADGQSHAASEATEGLDSRLQGRPTDCLSPEVSLRGFLDEILAELDQEENGIPLADQTDPRSNFDLLEDEMDGDIHQDGNHDEGTVSRTEIQDGGQGDPSSMSARLQRAVLRAQRRERNRRKGARRKLRKQERWREKAEAREQGLAEEEQTLRSDPDRLLNLLGASPPSKSLRDALTCPVCLDIYYNPHLCLPCAHVFCEPCLRRLAHTLQTSVTVPCPLCRTVVRRAQLHGELMASIVEMFPHITEQRKRAERRTLNKSYPLPGENAPTSLSEWISRTLAGRRRNRLHHLNWRGGHPRPAGELFRHLVLQFVAVTLLMVSLVGLCAIFISVMMQHL